MKLVRIGCGIVVLLALFVKLFTFGFSLRDDPTVGITLRATPSLTSRIVMLNSPSSSAILTQGENGFVAEGMYRSFVAWGWLLVIGAAICVAALPKTQSPIRRRSVTGSGS